MNTDKKKLISPLFIFALLIGMNIHYQSCEQNDDRSSKTIIKSVFFIRHGKTEKDKKYRKKNRPLSASGRNDIKVLSKFAIDSTQNIQLILCGEEKCDRSTAKIIAKHLDKTSFIKKEDALTSCRSQDIFRTLDKLNEDLKEIIVITNETAMIQAINHYQTDTIFTSLPTSSLVRLDFYNNWSSIGHKTAKFRQFSNIKQYTNEISED